MCIPADWAAYFTSVPVVIFKIIDILEKAREKKPVVFLEDFFEVLDFKAWYFIYISLSVEEASLTLKFDAIKSQQYRDGPECKKLPVNFLNENLFWIKNTCSRTAESPFFTSTSLVYKREVGMKNNFLS